jgi:hypothetical protein
MLGPYDPSLRVALNASATAAECARIDERSPVASERAACETVARRTLSNTSHPARIDADRRARRMSQSVWKRYRCGDRDQWLEINRARLAELDVAR